MKSRASRPSLPAAATKVTPASTPAAMGGLHDRVGVPAAEAHVDDFDAVGPRRHGVDGGDDGGVATRPARARLERPHAGAGGHPHHAVGVVHGGHRAGHVGAVAIGVVVAAGHTPGTVQSKRPATSRSGWSLTPVSMTAHVHIDALVSGGADTELGVVGSVRPAHACGHLLDGDGALTVGFDVGDVGIPTNGVDLCRRKGAWRNPARCGCRSASGGADGGGAPVGLAARRPGLMAAGLNTTM